MVALLIPRISTARWSMKRPEELRDEFVRGWLEKADEDLAVADHLLAAKTPFFSAVRFHAQQAAEKYLKALLAHYQIEFPKTHDLDRLVELASSAQATLPSDLHRVATLNAYGVAVRYPGDFPEVHEEEATTALEVAKEVQDIVLRWIREPPPGNDRSTTE